jgi:hypothetical protein
MKFRVLSIVTLIWLLTGCQIERFNRPPMWASAVSHHFRVFGLDASIPVYSGVVIGVRLGVLSESDEITPCSTNKVYAAPVSDAFRIGQSINPLDTQIIEDVVSGWDGTPPTPRLNRIIIP